jgi:transposase-like protein
MKKRTPREWRRLVAAYELGCESRRGFCERHGVAASTLDYWRRRVRGDAGGRLVEVQMETVGPLAGVPVPAVVIIWPAGVRVELGAGAASVALLSALHGAFGGGGACSR